MYIFTTDNQVQDLFINATQAGSMCMNDTIMQYAGKNFITGRSFGISWTYYLSSGRFIIFFWCDFTGSSNSSPN